MSARILAVAGGLMVTATVLTAQADPMDTALERLVTNPACNVGGEFAPGVER